MRAIEWTGEALRLLDQRTLPHEEIWETYTTSDEIADAIVSMKVRGAPAIGAVAAFAVALEAKRFSGEAPLLIHHLYTTMDKLNATRPTAVNLAWAIQRMRSRLKQLQHARDTQVICAAMVEEAERIASEDVLTNKRIGEQGLQLFEGKRTVRILTHCNTGSLATVEYGTALGIIRSLHQAGKCDLVFVGETRPYLQGARLTAYELITEGINHVLITDSMAASFMQQGEIDAVIVGADRIAANGDTANKIGTYGLAVLANYHKIPFYVAAPKSTFDLNVSAGSEIPIEERSAYEVTHWHDKPIAPHGTQARHPAFDVTPASLISAIVTEYGIVSEPNTERIYNFFK